MNKALHPLLSNILLGFKSILCPSSIYNTENWRWAQHGDNVPNEMKWCCFMPPLCTFFRLNWAKQAKVKLMMKHAPEWVQTSNPVIRSPTRYLCCARHVPNESRTSKLHINLSTPDTSKCTTCNDFGTGIHHRMLGVGQIWKIYRELLTRGSYLTSLKENLPIDLWEISME